MKRGSLNAVAGFILGLIVLLIMIGVSFDTIKRPVQKILGLNVTEKTDNSELIISDNEESVLNSVNALIEGINSVARENHSADRGLIDKSKFSFDSYKITFSAKIKTEGNGEYDWAFSRTFNLTNRINLSADFIFADYYLGTCYNKGITPEIIKNNGLSNFGTCSKKDNLDTLLSDYYEKLNNYYGFKELNFGRLNLAIVKQLLPVHNIKLETYKNGKLSCTVTTAVKSDFFKGNDLLTWGYWPDGCFGVEGCDYNKDGIPGSVMPSLIGLDAKKQLGKKWESISKAQKDKYYPNNKLSEFSEQGCLDSANVLECDGIKIYYCGKTGFKSGQEVQKSTVNEYFLKYDGEVHSSSSLKVLTELNPKIKQTKAIIEPIRSKSKLSSMLNYINTRFMGDPFENANYQAGSKTLQEVKNSPRILCTVGQSYGHSKLSCDEFGCNVCNFILPQQSPNEGDKNKAFSNWIAGNGDPEYLIYYESFPRGEEAAWQIDPAGISLKYVAALSVIGGAASLAKGPSKSIFKKIGGQKILGKIGSFSQKIVFAASKTKTGVIVKDSAKRISEALGTLSDSANNPFFSFLRGFFKIGALNKVIKNSDDILKYASKSELKAIGTSADEIAEALIKNDQEFINLARDMLKESPDVISKSQVYARIAGGTSRIATENAAEYAVGYSFGLLLSLADSQNEKYIPLGINKIGFKSPYKGSFFTGDGNMLSLADESKKYYLALLRDYTGANGGISDQASQRFFLASPCYADLKITKAKCLCAPPEETDYVLHDFGGGKIPVLTNSIKIKNGNLDYSKAIKTCVDPMMIIDEVTKAKGIVYQTDCIAIDPVLKNIDNNFCYSGDHTLANTLKWTTFAGTFGLDVATDIFGVSGVLAGGAGVVVTESINMGLSMMVNVAGAIIEQKIEEHTKWPNH